MDHPKIRFIEAFPVEDRGERRIVIRDPQNITDRVLAVAPEAFFIIAMLDGKNSVTDIQVELMRRFGQLVPGEAIQALIRVLDENYFLDNDRFQDFYGGLVEEFRQQNVRPSTCAGGAYADDPDELKQQVQRYFDSIDGKSAEPRSGDGYPIKAIISPHIDYQRGGLCYAQVYQKLSNAPPPDVFIILGTGHAGPRGHYVFTKKDFETPLGAIHTDREFIERLEARVGQDLCEEEFIHKGEHSVELQLVFIQMTYPKKKWPKIVPILCGGFHAAMHEGKVPSEVPEVKRFLEALKQTIAESGKRICVTASADLAHVGPRFGDERRVEPSFLRQVENEDLEMLKTVDSLDADGFFRSVQKDQDRRRICGLASIYTLLSVTDARKAELLKYSQAADPNGDQCVTFCGMTFH